MYLLYSFCTQFPTRVIHAHLEKTAIVDVDESYLYKKYRILTEAGEKLPSHHNPSHQRQAEELLIVITLLDPVFQL